MAAILDTGTERVNDSESPCHPDASHQVLAQSDLLFGSSGDLQIFKMVAIVASWISERNRLSNSKSPCWPDAFHQVSAPSYLQFRNR